MSYPPAAPAPNRKTFTPAIIAALVALVVLAAITFVVVARSDGSSTTADPSEGVSTPSEALETFTSADSTFEYARPDGWVEDDSMKSIQGIVFAIKAADESAQILCFTMIADGDGSLATSVEVARDTAEAFYNTTFSDTTPLVPTIDGETARAIITEPIKFEDGSSGRAMLLIVVHNGNAYQFRSSYDIGLKNSAEAQFTTILKSVRWAD